MQSPTIYWHIGTERTGTKFLQQSVFPKFSGVGYIDRSQFHNAKAIIEQGQHSAYLVSFELNLNADLEPYIQGFLAQFPDTIPMVVFRPQHEWLVSQYKRHVKNGKPGTFNDMLDVDTDNGIYKRDDLSYTLLIQKLEKYFVHKPIVFLYTDMQKQPAAFIRLFAEQIEATVNLDDINLTPHHQSYTEKQLMVLQSVSKYIDISKTKKWKYKLMNSLHGLLKNTVRYGVLYLAKLVPSSYFKHRKLIKSDVLDAVKTYYRADWEVLLKSPYPRRIRNN